MTTNDGGPAFPVASAEAQQLEFGMSLRDWFAGQALVGLLSQTDRAVSANGIAVEAYIVADAMLAAREARHD